MATDLTKEAQEGQAPFTVPNPHMYSSPAWMGWEAGTRMRAYGKIIKATAGRDYSVNASTDANDFVITFNKANLMEADIWRKG